jgi:23S rRNA (uracil1939-C5)-methyltransferase
LSKSKKDWAEGKAVHFHQYAPNRIQPFCDHFGICGGCKWQMLPYADQLKFKEREVASNLQRIGKILLPQPLPIAGSPLTTTYRNKLEFTFSHRRYLTQEEMETLKQLPEGTAFPSEPAAGFHVPGYFDKVVDIETCHLQQEPSNAIRNFVRKFAIENNFTFYNLRAHEGWLRTMIVRVATTGEVMVNICFGYDEPQARETLLNALHTAFPHITTLLFTINTKKNDSIHDLTPQVFYGMGYITEKLGRFIYKIGPKSFFQTNSKQAEQLYTITKAFAELNGSQVVYDLYCGTGSIGIFVSDLAKQVIGVEVIAEAIEDAKENAALNNITNTAFFAGDAAVICDDAFFAQHGRPDVIITDPPRAGMHAKLVEQILQMEAPVVVYVSCNPATQARDLQLLSAKYDVTAIRPVDMFPHTHHIENIVQLKLRKD